MKHLLHRWWVLAGLLGLAPLSGIADSQPFVQRVAVTDFLLLETNNDLALSPASQLVICFPAPTRPAAVIRAVALRRNPAGKWQLAYLAATPPGDPGQFRREEWELDPTIARNVLTAFRHLLETNVYLPTGALYQPSENDNAWILVRDRTTALAGVTLTPAIHARALRGMEDVTAYTDLCAGLVGVFVAPAEEREEILAQLDRFAASYVAMNRLDRR